MTYFEIHNGYAEEARRHVLILFKISSGEFFSGNIGSGRSHPMHMSVLAELFLLS